MLGTWYFKVSSNVGCSMILWLVIPPKSCYSEVWFPELPLQTSKAADIIYSLPLRIRLSQNNLHWKRLLGVIWSRLLLKTACSGASPLKFLISLRMEISQPLLAICVGVSSHPRWFFLPQCMFLEFCMSQVVSVASSHTAAYLWKEFGSDLSTLSQ